MQVHQYVQSLGRVAREIGVEIRCGARVDQLRMEVRLFLSLPFLDVIDTSHLDTDADDSNNEDEDDENNLGLMTFPESPSFSAGWSSGRGGA